MNMLLYDEGIGERNQLSPMPSVSALQYPSLTVPNVLLNMDECKRFEICTNSCNFSLGSVLSR